MAVVDQSFIPVTDIDAADFNGDSIQDLVVSVPHNGSRTAILIGNGDGTFRAPLVSRPRSSTFLSRRPSPITTVTASRTSRSAWETAASD